MYKPEIQSNLDKLYKQPGYDIEGLPRAQTNAPSEKQCKFYRFNGVWNIDPSWLDLPSSD